MSMPDLDRHADTCEKNGKRGMLGHPSIHCWLLWFLVIVQCFIFTFDFFSYGHFGTFLPELSLHCLVSDEGEICCCCCVFSKMVCLGAFSTQHRLCGLQLLASNVGRPG